MIEFQHVSKIYKGGKVAVEDVNLSFEKGEFICFIGTSGSGKTTCMRMINRMTDPPKGKILIDGKSVTDINPVRITTPNRLRDPKHRLDASYDDSRKYYISTKTFERSVKKNEIRQQRKMIDLVELPREMLDRYPSRIIWWTATADRCCSALAADQDIIFDG